MGMVVQHNMSAMNANRNLGITATNLSKPTAVDALAIIKHANGKYVIDQNR